MRAWMLALAVLLVQPGAAGAWSLPDRPFVPTAQSTAAIPLAQAATGSQRQSDGLVPVPALSARVVDAVGLLDSTSRARIEEQLAALERETGAQVAFLIVDSTQPEDIASFANRVGNTWKIGRQGVGDGVLLVVARDDRKVRIEVAKTLEGAIPDLAARQIIEDAITPAFRRGDFAGGLQAAADQISARVRGEALPPPRAGAAGASDDGFNLSDLAIFLFIGVPLLAQVLRGIFGRKLGAVLAGGGAGLIAWAVSASIAIGALAGLVALALAISGGAAPLMQYGRRGRGWHGGHGSTSSGSWGGGGFGGGSGGGFSSGGGGDFGGGGASGDW